MNEIITENATEIMEPIVEVTSKVGIKHVVIGFATGVATGVAGTKAFKAANNWRKARKEKKAEGKKHYIETADKNDDDVVDIATDQ